MRTSLGYGIELNKESTLKRQGIVVVDARVPARLNDSAYVFTAYSDREYKYVGRLTITPTEPLAAVEVRFIAFDVFGDRQRLLSMTEVIDLPAGTAKSFTPEWRLYSENDAEGYNASLAYVARVRTQAGRVIYADLAPVLAEARRFSQRLTEADLTPKPPQEPGASR